MIRAIVWKELREQGLIAIMLAVLGGGLMIAAAEFADPPVAGAPPSDVIASLDAGRLLTLMLVVTAGMVCGGALFAAEREAGTMGFLEALPTARWALWRAKLVAGVTLAAAEVALLVGAAVALGFADRLFIARLAVYALLAFAWGMFGSTLARTTLGSVGIAIPTATVATFVYLLPIYLFFSQSGSSVPRPVGWMLFEVLMVITPLALSAWRFTAIDRIRAADAHDRVAAMGTPPGTARVVRAGWGVRALVWLTLRQLRTPALVLSAFALVFGLSLLLPTLRPVLIWPMLALTAGVLAGVTAFGDEQSHHTSLFWSEHRLPIGRAWGAKIAMHLLLLAWLLVLLAAPSFIRWQVEPHSRFLHGQTTLAAVFHTRLFDELGSQSWKFLLVPAVYGFVFGHLCCLLFRKLVVASGVAVMLGGSCAALWETSLLAGGVRHWQLWVPAVVVLITGRVLIRSWAADRVHERGTLVRAATGMAAALVALGLGIGYRVVQVREEPGSEDDIAYVNSLPPYDQNVGGREFRTAAERFARTAATLTEPPRTPDPVRRPRFDDRLKATIQFGWPNEDTELGEWMDRMYIDASISPGDLHWSKQAALAATRPIGVYDPPQLVSAMAATAAALDNAKRMAVVILARGLQQQARGDPAAFVPCFQIVATLARTTRNGGGTMALEAGMELERMALQAADRWLTRLPLGHATHTQALATAAAECDDLNDFDLQPHILVDRYIVRGMMQVPNSWLTVVLRPPGQLPDENTTEIDLVAFAWTLPWERERTRRLVSLSPQTLRHEGVPLVFGRPGSPFLLNRGRIGNDMVDRELYMRLNRRALILKAAIRAYRDKHGSPPTALADLVTHHVLTRLPTDPFAENQSYGYRVSAGEVLSGPPRVAGSGRAAMVPYELEIKPGEILIWSVGVDQVDQGGKVPPGGPRAPDIVYIVPAPAELIP